MLNALYSLVAAATQAPQIYITCDISLSNINFFCSIKFQNLLQLNQYLIEYLVRKTLFAFSIVFICLLNPLVYPYCTGPPVMLASIYSVVAENYWQTVWSFSNAATSFLNCVQLSILCYTCYLAFCHRSILTSSRLIDHSEFL